MNKYKIINNVPEKQKDKKPKSERIKKSKRCAQCDEKISNNFYFCSKHMPKSTWTNNLTLRYVNL